MRKSGRNIQSKNKKKIKAKKKLTSKDIIRIFLIVLICAILLLGIGARFIHFYQEHFK